MTANHWETHDPGCKNASALYSGKADARGVNDGPPLSIVEPQGIGNNLNAPSSATGSTNFMSAITTLRAGPFEATNG